MNYYELIRIQSLILTIQFRCVAAPDVLSLRHLVQSFAYTAAITTCHKLLNLKYPGNSFLVEKLLTAALKTKTNTDCRLPITKQRLSIMLGHLSQVNIKSYDIKMYRAMFLLAFYTFLGIVEITISSVSADTSKLVQVDVLGDSKGISKTMKLYIRNTNH